MKISPSNLQALSQLAYLAPNLQNMEVLTQEINAILDFVEQIDKDKVDTQGIAPLFHPMDMQQALRPDEVTEKDCLDALAEIAVLFEDGHFLVPKVIEGK